MPAAMELSTGLTEDAWTRTSTSRGPGVGVGRSSRRAGDVPASLRVMAFISGESFGSRGQFACSSERLRDVVADVLGRRRARRGVDSGSHEKRWGRSFRANDNIDYST